MDHISLVIVVCLIAFLWIPPSMGMFPGKMKIPTSEETNQQSQYVVEVLQCSYGVPEGPTDYFGSGTACQVVMYNETTPTIAGTFVNIRPFTADIMFRATVYKMTASNTWMPMLITNPDSVCEHAMRNKKSAEKFFEHSNVTLTCPIPEGVYVFEDSGPVTDYIPNNFQPGKYLLNGTIYLKEKIILRPYAIVNVDLAVTEYED